MSLSTADRVYHASVPVIDRIARLGFLSHGIIMTAIGAVGLRLVLGNGGAVVGPEGALARLFRQPFGSILLGTLALGLLAHALWKFVQAFLDPEDKGTRFTAVAERVAFAATGVGYVSLAWAAVRMLAGEPGGGVDVEDLAARVLRAHFGRAVVGFFGLVLVVAGILQLRLAITAGFRPILLLESMTRAERRLVTLLGRVGYAAISVLSGLVGYFLIRVALEVDPSEAGGWDEALGFIAGLENGRWWLGVVAAGVVVYGFYHLFLVRYRRV